MEKYICYIDESGCANMSDKAIHNNRFLCLCGIIMNFDYAKETTATKFKLFKEIYSIENQILHLSEIKRFENGFAFLKGNDKLLTQFYFDLAKLLESLDFKIISIVIDKLYLKEKYINPVPPYHYALTLMLENFISFLQNERRIRKESNLIGKVSVESRNSATLDLELEKHFKDIHKNGNR